MSKVKKIKKVEPELVITEIEEISEKPVISLGDKKQDRLEYMLKLKNQGISVPAIIKAVNRKAEEGKWDKISRRTYFVHLAKHYKSQSLDITEAEDYSADSSLRSSQLEVLEKTIEKLVGVINDPDKKWKSFEKQDAIKKLFDMQDRLTQIENWDKSKHIVTGNTFIKNELNILQDGTNALSKLDEDKKSGLLDMLDSMIASKKNA